eukprot:12527698-Alexandrium_andersonii.AAC.1
MAQPLCAPRRFRPPPKVPQQAEMPWMEDLRHLEDLWHRCGDTIWAPWLEDPRHLPERWGSGGSEASK